MRKGTKIVNLDIVGGADLQEVGDVEGPLKKSIAGLEVVEDTKVLGEETELWVGDLATTVVLEGEFELGQVVEELAGDLVEEHGAVAVELGRHPHSREAKRRESAAAGGGDGWVLVGRMA